MYFFRCLVFLLFLIFLGCNSLFMKSEPSRTSVNAPSIKKVIRENAGEPFQLEVLEEEFSQGELFLTIALVAFERFDLDRTVLRLATIDSGEVLSEKVITISELHSKFKLNHKAVREFVNAVKFNYGVNIKAKPEIDYQVELLWGKDASPYLKQSEVSPKIVEDTPKGEKQTFTKTVPYPDSVSVALKGLNVSRTRFCHNKNKCEIEFRLSANIQNVSNAPIREVVMAVGYLDKESKEYSFGVRIPKEEELVRVPELSLLPGKMQSVNLTLEQRIPESDQNRIIPVLRLVDIK